MTTKQDLQSNTPLTESAKKIGTAALVGIAILAASGCSTIQPTATNQYVQQSNQAAPFSTFAMDAKQALANPSDAKNYDAAKRNAGRVDEFGRATGNIVDQHVTNWGRAVGGSLAGRYVDPGTLFPVNQSFRPEHPSQKAYVMPNNMIVTTFVTQPTKKTFSLTNPGSKGVNYSAVYDPQAAVEIKPEEVSQVGQIIQKELQMRTQFQNTIIQDGNQIDPTKAGSWKGVVTNHEGQASKPAETTAPPAVQGEETKKYKLCRELSGGGVMLDEGKMTDSKWQKLVDEQRQPGSAIDQARNGKVTDMQRCEPNSGRGGWNSR